MGDIIRIADHADRFIRLHVMNEESPIDPEMLDAELEVVLRRVFGGSFADYDAERFPKELEQWWDQANEWDAEEYALAHGYSLETVSGNIIPDWESFLELIIAKVYGLIAVTPEEKAALRLKAEAQAFREYRKRGGISGY